jgi:hypothetical protein
LRSLDKALTLTKKEALINKGKNKKKKKKELEKLKFLDPFPQVRPLQLLRGTINQIEMLYKKV